MVISDTDFSKDKATKNSSSGGKSLKWFQFELRTLFLLVLIASPMAVLAPELYVELFPPVPTKDIQYLGPVLKLNAKAKVLQEARDETASSIAEIADSETNDQ